MNSTLQYLLLILSMGWGIVAQSSLQAETIKQLRKDIITYEGFKNACDVIFVHTDPHSENQYMDPTWFRNNELSATSHQRIIYLDKSFDPEIVQPGDLVFVRKPKLFFEKIHPFIKHPYIVVTHGNSSSRFKRQQSWVLDEPNVIAWFSIHIGNKVHPKLHPLPLGVRKSPYVIHNGKKIAASAFFTAIRKSTKKTHLVYMNFLDRTHPERPVIKALFNDKPFCLYEDKVNFDLFMKHTAESKFVFAPRGVGPADSFRIWESLAVRSIPIVKKNPYMDLSLYEGLPVLIVSDWKLVTEDFLEETYKKLSTQPFRAEKLFMGYWLDSIIKVRDQFLQQYKLARETTGTVRLEIQVKEQL